MNEPIKSHGAMVSRKARGRTDLRERFTRMASCHKIPVMLGTTEVGAHGTAIYNLLMADPDDENKTITAQLNSGQLALIICGMQLAAGLKPSLLNWSDR